MTATLRAPALDHALSPHTGWTRAHWEHLADRMLLDVRPSASPDHARITLPGPVGGYGRDVDGLEGFARTFLAAAFRLAGSDGSDPHDLAGWYAEGIAAGCDPTNPGRWVRPDEHDQAKVEAAAIALGLSMTRPLLWDRMGERAQQDVVAWLSTVIGADYPPINWVWFRIVVEQFLKEVGAPHSVEDMEHDLDLHDTFVRADGWYADGAERSYDHYTGWALHLYPVLWLRMAGADDALAAPRRERYLAHLDRFLPDAARLVGADGSPLVQGRSLIYRFAAAAPFWAGALAGSTALAPGLVRRAASGVVSHFVENGAFEDGILRLGWHREWRPLAQSYSGPGSPYWASKGLLGLALPADHPVWTAVEEPLPIEVGDVAAVAQAPGWLISGTRSDGIVRVVNHGTDHALPGSGVTDAPLYARLGYSTATSPLLDSRGEEEPFDQSVVLLDPEGLPSHRAGFARGAARTVDDGRTLLGSSTARAHWVGVDEGGPRHGSGRSGALRTGPTLTTVSLVRGPWEVRLVRVGGPEGDVATGPLRVGGWAAPGSDVVARIEPLLGLEPGETRRDADATPLGPATTASLRSGGDAEPGRWYAAAVLLTRAGAPVPATPRLRVEGDHALVHWADGTRTALDPAEVTQAS